MYNRQKADEFILRLENILDNYEPDSAFEKITKKLEQIDDIYLNDCIAPLNFIRHERTLDWIESSANRITKVGSNWGHLAASAYFSWDKASKWLDSGRPLSLIALDALLYCTTRGPRLNQSLWMRENNPTLTDNPKLDVVARGLQNYLKVDNVPRTKIAVEKIINNIFDI